MTQVLLAGMGVAAGFAIHPLATVAATLLAGAVLLAAGPRAAFLVLGVTLVAAFAGLRVDAFPR